MPAPETAVHSDLSAERCQLHPTPDTSSSGSLNEAVNAVPTKGCGSDSDTVPASSTLVTVTVTGSTLAMTWSQAHTSMS